MFQLTYKYRTLVAQLLAIWTLTIIISGVVFMHKEVTSTGEIVMHTHPYDFTKKNQKQHHSDNEIQFLNIVFHGAYLLSDLVVFETPIFSEYAFSKYAITQVCNDCVNLNYSHPLRGPPLYA